MLDRICAKHGRELIEHGIGFKFVCDYMLEREIVMGGEESGGIGFQRHLPERDGLLNALLLANVMAEEGKTLGQLVADLQAEYGEHQYGRIDLHIPDDIKNAAIARAKRAPARRSGLRRHAHPAPGNPRRRQVLPRQPRSQNQAQRRRNLDSSPRQRHRAPHAHLHRVLPQKSPSPNSSKQAEPLPSAGNSRHRSAQRRVPHPSRSFTARRVGKHDFLRQLSSGPIELDLEA